MAHQNHKLRYNVMLCPQLVLYTYDRETYRSAHPRLETASCMGDADVQHITLGWVHRASPVMMVRAQMGLSFPELYLKELFQCNG